jgi:chemotaxis-related protein WspB
MQLLVFSVGTEHYAIESRRVVEVLPLVTARPIPHMPDSIRGIFTHRGRLVPLIDLGRLFAHGPLRETLGTRVIVVEFSPAGGPAIRLGVMAENVLSLRSGVDAEATLPAIHPAGAAALGRLLRIDGSTLQVIDVEHLLPPDMLAGLLSGTPTATAASVLASAASMSASAASS